jgi:hypothetical protein
MVLALAGDSTISKFRAINNQFSANKHKELETQILPTIFVTVKFCNC